MKTYDKFVGLDVHKDTIVISKPDFWRFDRPQKLPLRPGGRFLSWPSMICGIDHLNIVVTDLARSLRFYCDLLGFTQTHEAHLEGEWIERIVGLPGVRARAIFIVAPAGEPRIELLHYENPPGTSLPANSQANTIGLRHIAFRVDDMATTVARLRAANVPLFSQPVPVPGGVVKFAAGDKTLVYFLDPDGVILELAEYRSQTPVAGSPSRAT